MIDRSSKPSINAASLVASSPPSDSSQNDKTGASKEMTVHEIARVGGTRKLKELLKENKNCHKYIDNEKGWSPLHYAASFSKTKAVEILLETGANPNSVSKKNPSSPMDVACGPNRKAILILLREKGGHFAKLTLHTAVEDLDRESILEFLEDDTVNINERDSRGWMPIHYAVECDYKDIVELLLENGANVNGATLDGLNPLEIANDKGNEELLKFLHEKGGKPSLYRSKRTKKQPAKTSVKTKSKATNRQEQNTVFSKIEPRKLPQANKKTTPWPR